MNLRLDLSFLSVLAGMLLAAPIANAQKSTNTIYGDDNRLDLFEVEDAHLVDMAASTVALVRPANIAIQGENARLSGRTLRSTGVCEGERFVNQATPAFCSGSLVGPDLILTAGHCVRDAASCANTRFVFGFGVKASGGEADAVNVPTSEIYSCGAIVSRKEISTGGDYAVIRLNRPVTNHRPLEINRDSEPTVGTSLVMIGHPTGLPVKVAAEAKVRAVNSAGFFVATTDSFGGNSGSAVFNSDTRKIEGVLVRGAADYMTRPGENCTRPAVFGETEGRGEDVTRISEARAFIP